MNKIKVEIEVIIPEWTNWIATDKNGSVFSYEKKPVRGRDEWDHCYPDYGNMQFLYRDKPPKNWKDELYTWS